MTELKRVCVRMCVCVRVSAHVCFLAVPTLRTLPAARVPAGDTQASPGMDSCWRGTSQSRGHSADIQSAFASLRPDRRGNLPASLTCASIRDEPVRPGGGKRGRGELAQGHTRSPPPGPSVTNIRLSVCHHEDGSRRGAWRGVSEKQPGCRVSPPSQPHGAALAGETRQPPLHGGPACRLLPSR